jgi:predicted house-cleaning NTP pyrophosphatase (Maf/HAM1 superfamily)
VDIGNIDLVLASGSRYRAELLARIAPRFRQLSRGSRAPRPKRSPPPNPAAS